MKQGKEIEGSLTIEPGKPIYDAVIQFKDWPAGTREIQVTNAHLSGAVAPGGALRFSITDRGVCTMSAGACPAQSLGSTYASAPFCFGTWTGGGTLAGTLKITSTTTTVTPQSSTGTDTAQVNWICFGN